MDIDPHTEELITLHQAAAMFPSRPHISAIYRWTTQGLRGVKLDWVQAGNCRATSREAVARFIAAATALAQSSISPVPTLKNARGQAAEEAGREIDRTVFGRRSGKRP